MPRGGRVRRVLLPLAGEDAVGKAWRDAQDSTGGTCSTEVKPGAGGCLKQAAVTSPEPP